MICAQIQLLTSDPRCAGECPGEFMYVCERFHKIQNAALRLLLGAAFAGLFCSPSCILAQSAPAKGNQEATSGPASTKPAANATLQQAVATRHLPRPPIQILRLHGPGVGAAAPVAPFAIAGAHADYFGGPVIANVHIVQVLYGTGAYLPNIAGTATPTLQQFYNDITQSSYFDLLNEYSTVGVTAADGTAGTNQTIGHGFFDGLFTINPSPSNDGPTITDGQIQSELLAQVTAGHLPAPVFDAQGNDDTLYMIFFPPGKTITAGGARSCVQGGFCAYHNSTIGTFASHRLFYGVHPDLQPPSGCSQGCGSSGDIFDNVTTVTSHELSEAVTDADVGPATTLGRPLAWIDPVNSEIGDICVGQADFVTANGSTYTVQREFSNLQNDCEGGPPRLQLQFPSGQIVSPGQQFDVPLTISTNNGGFLLTYGGTVHFTSSDPKAVLPADYTFNFADAGAHTFVATLNTPGPQTITVTDPSSPFLTGSGDYSVNNPAATFTMAMPGNAVPGTAIPVFVTARGQSNQVATSYTGTIHFTSTDSGAVLPADTTLVNGTGSFVVTFNTAGFQTLKVQDTSDALISASGGSLVAATPANPTVTSVAVSSNPSTFGQAATYTATVTQGANPVTVGLVTFNADGIGSVMVPTDANGHAQTTISLSGGQHVIFAEFGGGASASRSSSAPLTTVVNPAPTTVTLSSNISPSAFGDKLAFTAQISSALGNTDGGTVTFSDGGVPIAVVSSAFNSAEFPDSSLPVGTHTIVASYSGTSNFGPSTSAPFVQVVNPAPAVNYSLTTDKTSATIAAGQAATFLITTTSVSGFNGAVKFACGQLPAFTTCKFSPSSVAVSPFATTVVTQLTIQTAGSSAQLIHPLRKNRVNAIWWAAGPFAFGLILVGTGVKRRTRFFALLGVCLALVVFVGAIGCGGGGSPSPPPPTTRPVTPAGTANVAVTATSSPFSGANATNPTQQLNLSVTVQ